MLHGGIAGLTMWAVVYPIDVLKSKIQNDSMASPKYLNQK